LTDFSRREVQQLLHFPELIVPSRHVIKTPATATSARTLVVMSESSPQDIYRRIIDALVARSGSIAERLLMDDHIYARDQAADAIPMCQGLLRPVLS
jgi:hypothetical protein